MSTSDEVREILPWLKLSTDLDPQNVQNYTVTAYWLRERMHKPDAAHEILLEGLQENPGSCDILFELGRLYAESDHDTNRAVNVWNAAVRNWRPVKGSDDAVAANNFIYEKITTQLGETERNAGHGSEPLTGSKRQIRFPGPLMPLQKMIDETRQQMSPSSLRAAPSRHPEGAANPLCLSVRLSGLISFYESPAR